MAIDRCEKSPPPLKIGYAQKGDGETYFWPVVTALVIGCVAIIAGFNEWGIFTEWRWSNGGYTHIGIGTPLAIAAAIATIVGMHRAKRRRSKMWTALSVLSVVIAVLAAACQFNFWRP